MNGISVTSVRNFLKRYKNSTMCLDPSIGAKVVVSSGKLKGVQGHVTRCVEWQQEYEIEWKEDDPWTGQQQVRFKILEVARLQYALGLTHERTMICQVRDLTFALCNDDDGGDAGAAPSPVTLVGRLENEGQKAGIGKATVLVSYPENSTVQKLLGLLEDFAARTGLSRSTLFWIDCMTTSVLSKTGAEEMGRLARRMAHTVVIVSVVRNKPHVPTKEEEAAEAVRAAKIAELEKRNPQMKAQAALSESIGPGAVPETEEKLLPRFCASPWCSLQIVHGYRNKVHIVMVDGTLPTFAVRCV
jgi:hypothetical protein